MKPSIKYQVIYKHKNKYSIRQMCKFFGVSRSGYYAFLKRLDIPDRDLPCMNPNLPMDENAFYHAWHNFKREMDMLMVPKYTETK